MPIFDVNDHAGDAHALPFNPGTVEAKSWWKTHIEDKLADNITPAMKAKYGSKVVGAYKGLALVPNSQGSDQGDFIHLRDKIMVEQGLSEASATKVAAKIKIAKYGV